MRWLVLSLTCATMLSLPAVAQSSSAKRARSVASVKKVKKKKSSAYTSFSTGLVIWQEDIKAKSGANSTNMETQSQGLRLTYGYNIPFKRSKWRQNYSADLLLGSLKGKASSATIQDELKNQPWVAVAFNPGLIYRTTPVSELGLFVPLTARMIQWQLKSGSPLSMEKETSFSAGLSLLYVNRITVRSSLQLSLTRQHMWESTAWGVGYEYAFR